LAETCQVIIHSFYSTANCFFVRKFCAIIFLIAVATSQYAKHISYLECRLSNYLSTESEKCDCEKIQTNTGDTSADTAPIPSHRHVHFDDSNFVLPFTAINRDSDFSLIVHASPYTASMSAGSINDLFRPPCIN